MSEPTAIAPVRIALLTTTEAEARIAGQGIPVARRTLQQWAHTRPGLSRKIGRRLFFDAHVLDALIAGVPLTSSSAV